eukprot:jgi/Ulvmu1/11504/UM077_0053.1
MTTGKADVFTVIVTGQIDSCTIPGVDNGYCKWGLSIGEDWNVLNGLGEGVTQLARRGRGASPEMVWNFPIDLTFQSTNAFGWPKLHFSVYGIDFLGTDVVQGYGFTHIPCCSGRFPLKVHLFKPKTKMGITGLQSWLQRRPAEFKQQDFACQSEGREVTTVMSSGVISLTLQVATKGMHSIGYDDGSATGLEGVTML